MSEIKRAQLLPLGPQKDSDKSTKGPRKTVRLTVVLPESTEDTCPEYNYKDELAVAKKSGKSKPQGVPNGLDPMAVDEFGEDDDDVRRIARQMEEKYGTGPVNNKKKRKGRKDDYADIGMGYDESDSFIDNTDGYDEIIPQNVTTLHGGFYINSGALEFKTDDEANSDFSSSSSSEDEDNAKPASRKRIIESSDDDDETDRENKTEGVDKLEQAEKKRKLQNGNGVQSSLKKKLLGQNQIYIKKRRPLDPLKKTVKELLREKREDLNMTIPTEMDSQIIDEDDKAPSKSNLSQIIESVVNASNEKSPPPTKDLVTSTPKIVHSSQNGDSSQEVKPSKPAIKLPENLPADIVSVITAIQKHAEKSPPAGSPFTSELNLLFLKLERKAKCLGKPSKIKVYEHLAACLKMKSEVLVKKAKLLILDDEQKRLTRYLSELKQEISRVMPGLLDSHEKESQRILQKKFSQESVENEDNKSLRMPKRRFQWNDISKKLLKDILMLKKRCLLLDGKTKEDLDAQMPVFIKGEIQILWPEGWMSMNALNKIYTTYAEKRLSSSGQPAAPSTPTIGPLPPSFNNSNLSITPIIPKSDSSTKVPSVSPNDVSLNCVDTSINLSLKSLPESPRAADVKPVHRESFEGKLKVKPACELLKPLVSNHVSKKDSLNLVQDDVMIIETSPVSPTVIKDEDDYCEVIDLSEKPAKLDLKHFIKNEKVIKETTITPVVIPERKHHDLSIKPTFSKMEQKVTNDELPKNYPKISKPDHYKSKTEELSKGYSKTDHHHKAMMSIDEMAANAKIEDILANYPKIAKGEDLGKGYSSHKDDSGVKSYPKVNHHHKDDSGAKSYPKLEHHHKDDSGAKSYPKMDHHHHHKDDTVSKSYPRMDNHHKDDPVSKSYPRMDSHHKDDTVSKSYPRMDSHHKDDTVSKNYPRMDHHHKDDIIAKSYPKMDLHKPKSGCTGDDIQKVMEDLKVLQNMSSPKKSVESSPTSSAVSVIAVNKSFGSKAAAHNHNSNSNNTMQRFDYNKSDLPNSFQDQFQKQIFSAFNHISTNPTKSYNNSMDRYPHISSTGQSMAGGEKYFQNSNNNYAQTSNGHKGSTSTPQTGTYSILDDMFANLLTQYGYSKEATAPKSQQK